MWSKHPSFESLCPQNALLWEVGRVLIYENLLSALKCLLKSLNKVVFGDIRIKKQEIWAKINLINLAEMEGLLDDPL